MPMIRFALIITLYVGSAFSQNIDAPVPPGKLVDLGGFRVHINCSGRGHPTVILLHGLGDYSFEWSLVLPDLARQTEVCAYDRPGQAWSEPGPPPRGVRTSADELHLLLQRSHHRPPYILVGHSWGGLIARMYAREYPHEVAGMVLVDSSHEDEYLWINGKVVRPATMTDEEWTALRTPARAPGAPSSATAPAHARMTHVPPPYDKLSPDQQQLWLWAMSQPRSVERQEGGDSTDLRRDFLAMRASEQREHPLGTIPLIVLSKTPGIDDDDDYTPEQLQWNRDLQSRLASLSTNSEHVVADHSGHAIQLEEPDLVIAAVVRVVDAVVRRRQPLGAAPVVPR